MRLQARDIRIAGGRIVEVGHIAPQPGERVIDAGGCVVYPGWVNAHHHLLQAIMKGVPGGLNVPLLKWLEEVPFAYRMRIDERTLETAALLGLAELMLSGCTTVADLHNLYYPGMGFDASAILFRAAERMGLRLVLCRGIGTRLRPSKEGSNTMPPEKLAAALVDVARLAKTYHDPSAAARRRIAIAPSMITRSIEPAELRELAREARQMGLRLHSHLAETIDDVTYCREVHGCSPVEFAARHEWIGPDVWFAHAIHLDRGDIRRLGETGTGVAHCPGSNCRIGSGIAPVPAMRAAGVRLGLGQDGGAANEPGDMIAEVHLAWYLHRAKNGPEAVTVEDVIHWGTRSGADALGLDAVGAIAPGYQADIAVYALDDFRFAAFHDVVIAPVATGIRPHLRCLTVGGRIVVEDDRIPGLDMDELRSRVRAAIRHLRNA